MTFPIDVWYCMVRSFGKEVSFVNNLMTIALLVAVLVYTVINYVTGKTSLVFFLICVLALSVPLLKMLSILFQEWKNR